MTESSHSDCPEEERLLAPDTATARHLEGCDQCRDVQRAMHTPAVASALATSAGTDTTKPNTSDDATLAPGACVGRFVVRCELARGGMGVVYEAVDTGLKRSIALKVLRMTGPLYADMRLRLIQEGRSLAQLDHPNVVTIYEVGEHRGSIYLAMELVDGTPLQQWLQQSRPQPEVLRVLRDAARGVAAVHTTGLLHRDIKPSNIVVSSTGVVKLIDFGLAVTGSREAPLVAEHHNSASSSGGASPGLRLTATGVLAGTPAYAAPEQLSGLPATARSDVFALCATAYEALSGDRPFRGTTPQELLDCIRHGAPPELPRGVSRAVRAAVRAGLSHQASDRPGDVEPLIAALHRGVAPRRWRRVVAAFAFAVVIAVAVAAAVASTSAPEVCTDAARRLAGVWDLPRRAAVQTRLRTVNDSFGEARSKRVTALLDRYANEWTQHYRAACRATAVHKSQSADLLDRRMACLELRRRELAAAVEVLESSDRTATVTAIDVAAELAPVALCANLENLKAVVPLPPDSDTRNRIFDTDRQLAVASAQFRAAQFERGLATATAATAAAQKLGYLPLVARAHGIRAQLLVEQGRYREAAESQQASARAAAAGGDAAQEAEMLAKMALLTAVWQSRYDAAAEQAAYARAVMARAQPEPAVELRVRADLAAAAMVAADHLTADREVTAGLALAHTMPEATPTVRLLQAQLLTVRAELHEYRADLLAAQRTYERVLELYQSVYGATHPAVASTMRSLGDVHFRAHQDELARQYWRRTDQLRSTISGQDNAFRRHYLAALSASEPDEQATLFRAALAEAETLLGAEHADVCTLHLQLGTALVQAARTPEAMPEFARAVQLGARIYGNNSPELLPMLTAQASALLDVGQVNDGVAVAERALAIAQQVSGDGELRVTIARLFLADAYGEQGKLEQSQALLIEARGDLARFPIFGTGELAALDYAIATLDWELHRSQKGARERARRAYEQFIADPAHDPEIASEMRDWLATKSAGG